MRSFLPLLSAVLLGLSLATTSTLSQDVAASRQMQPLMQAKVASRERCRESGMCGKYTSSRKGATTAKCVNGFAGEYPCKGIDLLSQLSNDEMGSFKGGESGAGEGADCWGWTSQDNREFGIFTQTDGTSFVEVLSSGEMIYLGRLPTQTVTSLWRDAKVVGNYAYIGAESTNHGVQIFDLRKLLDSNLRTSPKVFSTTSDVTLFRTSGLGSSHNIVEHPSKNIIVAVGQKGCSGGPYFIDISNPLKPVDLGCYSGDGYTHDAQIVVYKGPDTRYSGKTIMMAYNEDTLTILDISNVKQVKQISRTTYPGASYTHQGWFTDDSQTTILLDDELDEEKNSGNTPNGRTATYVWDVSNLQKPVQKGIYNSPVPSIDHNQYVVNGLSYQANYASGLRVVDTTGVRTGGAAALKEFAYFDVRPEDNVVDFFGSWTAYPFFKSGHILINSIERGAFVVKLQT